MATEQTYEFTKDNGTEYPARFKGQKVTYTVPSTLDEIRALIDPSVEDKDAVIVAGFNGQGFNLSLQKQLKDEVGKEAYKDIEPAEAVAKALAVVTARKIGAPRVKGEGKSGKVAKAEARASAAEASAREMYAALPKNLRKQFRERLIAQGTLTAEQLDEIDAA